MILQHTKSSKQQTDAPDREVLAGLVERVTFHSAENGFCVLRVKARGHRDLITLVGYAATISAGEWLTATGEWINDRNHGQQFKAHFLRCSAPTSADGIEKYLASGMIRGIGPVYAKKLVKAFGERVFDVIEAEPEKLRQVDGIGPIRAARITTAWAEQKVVREIMVFLHSHGVGTARAVRIFKTYGTDAVQVMSENLYPKHVAMPTVVRLHPGRQRNRLKLAPLMDSPLPTTQVIPNAQKRPPTFPESSRPRDPRHQRRTMADKPDQYLPQPSYPCCHPALRRCGDHATRLLPGG